MASKKSSNDPSDLARKVWLAGIGAYGRALGDAQERWSQAGKETAKMFEDLVEKGEHIEAKFEETRRDATAKVRKRTQNIDERMKTMRDNLGLGLLDPIGHRFRDIESRLETIEHKIDCLLVQTRDPLPAENVTPKKRATRKKAPPK